MGSDWGRIDETGAVFVKTAEGERCVGSWQAGDAEAGLAFFSRRFADASTEADLLAKRLKSGAGDAKATKSQAMILHTGLLTLAAVGDFASLEARLVQLVTAADAAMGEQAAARQAAKAASVAAKETLVAEAEEMAANATQWKVAGDRLRVMVEEWKAVKSVDRKTDDALWKRFAAARDAFGKRRGSHFAQLDADREAAKATKQGLVQRAQELSTSTDWRDTADSMKGLMAEWKAAPRANHAVEDALWTQFRAAQDAFFDRRSSVLAERDTEQLQNLKAKEEVLARAEGLDVSDPKRAQTELRTLQETLEGIGHVPREAVRRVEERMHLAEQRVRDAVDAQWQHAALDANPFLAQLRARLQEAVQKLAKAEAAGDPARIAKARTEVAQRQALLPG